MATRTVLAAVLCALAAVACGGYAHTPDEFKAMAKKSSFARTEHISVKRPFAEVFKDIQANADKCLNVSIHKQAHGGNFLIETTTTRLSPTRGQSVMQINGYLWLVTDIEARGKPATEVIVYGGARSEDYFKAYADWTRGTNADCPEF
jgi:hypothetical protein